jgi:chitinase
LKRRLFLLSGSASAASLALTACGGGGGGGAEAAGAGPTPVVLSNVAVAVADTATPTGGLPAKILGCYFTAWDSTYPITDVPAEFNVIYLFNASNGGTNTGDGSWKFSIDGSSYAQIQQVRQRGQKVILTVGGAGLGFAYTNRTQSTNCVNSIKNIISQIGGVDGVDFNNFEAGVVNASNVAAMSTEMVWIAQQLRAAYGADFAITSPPGGFNTGGAPVAGIASGLGASLELMVALKDAGLLTYAGPQYYDWNFYKGPGVVKAITDEWVGALGEEHVAIGLSANYDFSSSLTLAECQREMSAILAAHPNIRGAFCWSAQNNMSGGNAWGSTIKATLA